MALHFPAIPQYAGEFDDVRLPVLSNFLDPHRY